MPLAQKSTRTISAIERDSCVLIMTAPPPRGAVSIGFAGFLSIYLSFSTHSLAHVSAKTAKWILLKLAQNIYIECLHSGKES